MVGEFKDDQLQDHEHDFNGAYTSEIGNIMSIRMYNRDIYSAIRPHQYVAEGRHGNVTRGKRKGVKYIIKVL